MSNKNDIGRDEVARLFGNLAAQIQAMADQVFYAPPPAPAAEQAETGWREKCELGNKSANEWWVRYTTDDGLWLWYHPSTGWVGEPYQLNQPCFPTASAARLALSRAEEPKPAPASTPFDAKGWAERVVGGRGSCFEVGSIDGDSGWTLETRGNDCSEFADAARHYIAAALTAAHAAGRAEGDAAGYERGKAEQKPRSRWINIRRVGGENDPNARVVVEYYLDGRMIYLGEERVADNFSHGWNLSMREAQPSAGYNNNTIVCTKCGRPEGGDRDAR